MRIAPRFRLIEFESLPSTNTWLKEAALQGTVEAGTVVVVHHQTAGKGRLGRSWNSEAGQGLTFSLLLKPVLPPDKITLISLMTALAVKSGLEEYFNALGQVHRLGLRWPNDVMAGGRKLAGLLCETGTGADGSRFVVAGIGINVNQSEIDFPVGLRTPASSLYLLTSVVEDPRRILPYVLGGFDEACSRLEREGGSWIPAAWFEESGIAGSQVAVTDERGGRVVGSASSLTADGALVLDTLDGLRIIRSGDLTMA